MNPFVSASDGRAYNPWDTRQQKNTRFVRNRSELNRALTIAYENPTRLSVIKLADNIYVDETITLGNGDSTFAGVILDGSNTFQLITSSSMTDLLVIDSTCVIKNLKIQVLDTLTNVIRFASDDTVLVDGLIFQNDGYVQNVFNLSGTFKNTLIRNVAITNAGTLVHVFGTTNTVASISWTADNFSLAGTGPVAVLQNLSGSSNTYTYVTLSNFRTVNSANYSLTAALKGCNLSNFYDIRSIDPGTLGDGTVFIGFSSVFGSTFNSRTGNVLIAISGFTSTLDGQSTSLAVTGLHPGLLTNKNLVVDSATSGLVIKDTAGTPHYWRVGVSTLGALTTTDLGTSF